MGDPIVVKTRLDNAFAKRAKILIRVPRLVQFVCVQDTSPRRLMSSRLRRLCCLPAALMVAATTIGVAALYFETVKMCRRREFLALGVGFQLSNYLVATSREVP